jgi:hypothetical protein
LWTRLRAFLTGTIQLSYISVACYLQTCICIN